MKALTICQPYAHLIIIGDKRVENREWYTGYRGLLAVHAGKSRSWLNGATDADLIAAYGESPSFGALVGTVMLLDCLHIDRIENGEYDGQYPWLRDHAHTSGTWCWVVGEPKRLAQPVNYRGERRLFEVPDQLLLAA